MTLSAIVDKEVFDGCSADVQSHYTEKDGKFFLDVTSVGALELSDTTNIKRALATERTKSKTAETALSTFEGLDPDEARDALTKVAEMDGWDIDEKTAQHKEHLEKTIKAKYDADSAKLVAKHNATAETASKTNQQLVGQLEGALVDSAATMAIGDAKGSIDLLLPLVRSSTRMKQDESGKFVVEVVDADGTARLSTKAGNIDPMTIAEFVASLRDDERYAQAFRGTESSGSGASASDARGSSNGKITLSYLDSLDGNKYQAAKARALKEGKELVLLQR